MNVTDFRCRLISKVNLGGAFYCKVNPTLVRDSKSEVIIMPSSCSQAGLRPYGKRVTGERHCK